MRNLVETETHAFLVQCLADEVSAFWGDMAVLFAVDLNSGVNYINT